MSAAVRLMPSPPARVLSRKTKISVLWRAVREEWGVEGIEEGDKIRRYHSQLQLQHKYPHIMPLNKVAM